MIVVWLFLAVPSVCLQFVIVVFPDHTHLPFMIQDLFDFVLRCVIGATKDNPQKDSRKRSCRHKLCQIGFREINSVKSGNFGHEVNSEIHMQTMELKTLLCFILQIFTVCFVDKFLYSNN